MADSGQGSFKISLTILPEGYDLDLDHAPTEEDIDQEEELKSKRARTTYAQGGSVGKNRKLTGVKSYHAGSCSRH